MVDASRVDDAGRRAEALSIETGRGLVERLMIEGRSECAFLEVAADDGDGVDGSRRRNAQVSERSDEPAPRGIRERKVVDGGRKDVGDLLRDEILGGRHADEERLVEGAYRGARLLAERGVCLVAEDEVVRRSIELGAVSREPRVRLDRQRVLPERCRSREHGVREAVAVALGCEVTLELRDKEASVGEDQDAERARCIHEPGCRDRLPGRRRMAEPVAACSPWIIPLKLGLERLVVDEAGVEVVVGLLVEVGIDDDAVPASVLASVAVSILLGCASASRR